MKSKQVMSAIAVWYFLISGSVNGTFTQVGPFATQTACQNYQAGIPPLFGAGNQPLLTACFNTISKQ
jgi:hypothetical protein